MNAPGLIFPGSSFHIPLSLDVVLLFEAFHSIAVAFDVYDSAVMQQAVDHGGSREPIGSGL